MRIAGINKNDMANCDDGFCVSVWMQGCPHHCNGCHNPETWDFNGGGEVDRQQFVRTVIESIDKNGIMRHLSILGGEPLAPQNIEDTLYIINCVRNEFPKIKVYLWTGYTIEELREKSQWMTGQAAPYASILNTVDVLIEGRYDENLRDLSHKLKGSSNQRVLYRKNNWSTKKKCQG